MADLSVVPASLETSDHTTRDLLSRITALESEITALRASSGAALTAEHDAHLKTFLADRVASIVSSTLEALNSAASDSQSSALAQVKALAAALQSECEKSAAVAAKLREVEETQLLELHLQNGQLRERIVELEREVTVLQGAEDAKVLQLTESLRAAESEVEKLNGQLEALTGVTETHRLAVEKFTAKLRGGEEMDASRVARIAALEQRLLQQAHEANVALAAERERCNGELSAARARSDDALETAVSETRRVQALCDALTSDNRVLQAEVEALRVQHKAEVDALTARIEEQQRSAAAAPQQHEHQRQTRTNKSSNANFYASDAGVVCDDATKAEMLHFWFDGREQLRQLTLRLDDAEARAAEVPTLREQLRQHNASRGGVADSIVVLTEELKTARDAAHELRSTVAGLEAENNLLARQLVELLDGELTDEQLAQCRENVRRAAAIAARASTSIVYDEEALERTRRQLLQTQRAVAELTRKRDRLSEIVATRERRISQLNCTLAIKSVAAAGAINASGHLTPAMLQVISELGGPSSFVGDGGADANAAAAAASDELARKQKRLELLADVKHARERAVKLDVTLQSQRDRVAEVEAALLEAERTIEELRAEHAAELEALARRDAELAHENAALRRQIDDLTATTKAQRSALLSSQALCCQLLRTETDQLSLITSLLRSQTELRAQMQKQQLAADVEAKMLDAAGAENAFAAVLSTLQQHLRTVQMHVEWRARTVDEKETRAFAELAASIGQYQASVAGLRDFFAETTTAQLDRLVAASAEERAEWEAKIAARLAAAEEQRRAAEAQQQKAARYWDDAVVRAFSSASPTTAAAGGAVATAPAEPTGSVTVASLGAINASLRALAEAANRLKQGSSISSSSASVAAAAGGAVEVPASVETPSNSFGSGGLLEGVE